MTIRAYPDYVDSGVPWLGSIPSHWDSLPLKRIARLRTERAVATDFQVALENINSGGLGRFVETESEFGTDGVGFSAGDVLFGKLRPYLAKVWVASRDGEAVGDFHVLGPVPGCNSRFLFYQLAGDQVIDVISGSTYGAKMPRASWDFMGQLALARPPLPEQEGIAIFLDRETGKIDALVAEQERLIVLLKEKRQALISHAVTKGLDPNVPMKDSGVAWMGQIPAHWEVTRIHHACKLESGHTPSKQVPDYWRDCDIPWVSLADTKQLAVSDYISETATMINALGLENSSARVLPAGSVVFTRDATVGLAAITTRPMAVSQHLVAWCPSAVVDPVYLLRVVSAMRASLDSYTFGATLKTIGMDDVRSLKMPLPPRAEQQAIVDLLGTGISRIDALVAEAYVATQLLLERRSTVISAAVTGKIDVRGLA